MAETIAYAVCSLTGLEMVRRSVAVGPDDPDAFKAVLAAIHGVAASLIEAL